MLGWGLPRDLATQPAPAPAEQSATILVPLHREGGTYVVPTLVNDAITLNFTVDSGAADVNIPADVAGTLIRLGAITKSDVIGSTTYQLADGSAMPSTMFYIRSLKVGDKIVYHVKGNVAPSRGSLLLGQSFLSRFKSWSIDNSQQALILVE
jgi:predicted aspartyl protease